MELDILVTIESANLAAKVATCSSIMGLDGICQHNFGQNVISTAP